MKCGRFANHLRIGSSFAYAVCRMDRDGAVSGEFYRKDGYNDRELIERMI